MAGVVKVMGKLASSPKIQEAVTKGVKSNLKQNRGSNKKLRFKDSILEIAQNNGFDKNNVQSLTKMAKDGVMQMTQNGDAMNLVSAALTQSSSNGMGTVGPVGPLNPYMANYQTNPNELQKQRNDVEQRLHETRAITQQLNEQLVNARNEQNAQRQAAQNEQHHQSRQLNEATSKAGHTVAFGLNAIGNIFSSLGSGAHNVTNILGSITKSAGSTVTGAADTTFKSATSKPILWFIVGVIFVAFLVALIFGLVTRYSGNSGDDEYDDSNVTRIEINGDFNSIQRGQTYSSNSIPISRPSFTKVPDVNGGLLDWFNNKIATTEPFASGKTYYNMIKTVATGGSLVKVNREEDLTGRHDNIVTININNKIHNVLAPKPVIWSINEYQRDDLRILPDQFKTTIQDKYTVHIPWEKDGDHYYAKCNKTYYGNDPNKKINILLDDSTDKDMCSIYENTTAKPLYTT